MEILDNLEKRIDTLTNIIGLEDDSRHHRTNTNNDELNDRESENDEGGDGGGDSKQQNSFVSTTENIVDTLVSTNNIIDEAVSEHEQIRAVMKRSDELERYLDPQFLDESQDLRAKEAYLTATSLDMQTQLAQLQQIKSLEGTLGAEYFRNVPQDYADKLKQMNEDNTELLQQAQKIEKDLVIMMKECSDVQTNIMQSLQSLKERLKLIEERIERKQIQKRDSSPPPTTSTPTKS